MARACFSDLEFRSGGFKVTDNPQFNRGAMPALAALQSRRKPWVGRAVQA